MPENDKPEFQPFKEEQQESETDAIDDGWLVNENYILIERHTFTLFQHLLVVSLLVNSKYAAIVFRSFIPVTTY